MCLIICSSNVYRKKILLDGDRFKKNFFYCLNLSLLLFPELIIEIGSQRFSYTNK